MARQRATEQRRNLRRGDEIPFRTELHRAGTVVTQPGLVETGLHVGIEGQDAAGLLDTLDQAPDQAFAVRDGVGIGHWQRGFGMI